MCNTWTPVAEPPKVEGKYLVCAYHRNNPANREVFERGYFAGEWVGMWVTTHWQPLPELPELETA